MQSTDQTRTLCAHLYARTVRQLKKSSPEKLTKRLHRLHKLERSLHIPFGRSVLHYALPLMLATMLGTAAQTRAQVFADPVINPFGLTTPSQNPKFVDIDADGDIDIFGEFQWWENIGTADNPSFAAPVFEPFGMTTIPISGDSPGFADLDNDLDPDMLAVSGFQDYYYFENIGTPATPLFAEPVVNPMGLGSLIGSMSMSPAFADIDNVGDMDFFTGAILEEYAFPLFYQNSGSTEVPFFEVPVENVFGSYIPACTDYDSRYALGDIDNDGDMDMVVGFEGENLCILTNIGSPVAPSFILSPISIPDVGNEEAPALGDLDGDGDTDLMVANVDSWFGPANWNYFENLDCRLAVPASLSATAITPTSATLTWSPGGDGYDFVVKVRDLTAGGIRKKYVSEPTYTFTSLTPGHDYAFTVWTECADFDTRRGPSEVYYFSTPLRSVVLDAQALIYPNPAHDAVTIDIRVFEGAPVQICVYNTLGELVHSAWSAEGSAAYTLPLPHPPGTYYIQLIAGERTAVAAIVKN